MLIRYYGRRLELLEEELQGSTKLSYRVLAMVKSSLQMFVSATQRGVM